MLLGQLNAISELDTVHLSDEELNEHLGAIGKGIRSSDRKIRSKAYRAMNRLSKIRTQKHGANIVIREPDTKELTGKAKFEKRMYLMPADIKKGLIDGNQTMSSFTIYAIKYASGTRVEMFVSGDTKEEGITNINRAMLPNNSVMMVDKIQVLTGVGASNTEDDGKIVDFGKPHPILANGNFNFKNGQKIFVEDASNEIFNHGELKGSDVGLYELSTPKIIQPDKEIIFDIDLAGVLPANTFVKVMLHGVISVKA